MRIIVTTLFLYLATVSSQAFGQDTVRALIQVFPDTTGTFFTTSPQVMEEFEDLIRSRDIIKAAMEERGKDLDYREIEKIRRSLFVTIKPDRLFEVGLAGPPLEISRDLLAIIEAFTVDLIKQRSRDNDMRFRMLDEQLEVVRMQLESAEMNLEDFKREKGIIDYERERQAIQDELTVLNKEISDREFLNYQLCEIENHVFEEKFDHPVPSGYFPKNDRYLPEALLEWHKLGNQKRNLTDSFFAAQGLKMKAENLRSEILRYLNGMYDSNLERQDQIKEEMVLLRDKSSRLALLEPAFRRLEQYVKSTEQVYSELLERRSQMMIERASLGPPVRVVRYP